MRLKGFGIYLLTMPNGTVERWDAEGFTNWLQDSNQRFASGYESRLNQFRLYTSQDVISWSWTER